MKTKHLTINIETVGLGWFAILPFISIRHKFWYLWSVNFGWLWGDWWIDICRRDWKHKGNFDDSKDDEMEEKI